MVPAAFVVLRSLPLTANGKLDRNALPMPRNADLTQPTPVERTLAEVWVQLLNRERVGTHDNFFEAGGDALLATQLISRESRALWGDLSAVARNDASRGKHLIAYVLPAPGERRTTQIWATASRRGRGTARSRRPS